MTDEKKAEILNAINRALDGQRQAEAYKEDWQKCFRRKKPDMKFIVAHAREVGNAYLNNEMLKYIEIKNAIISVLYCFGFHVVFNDDITKAIDIIEW